MAVSIALYRQVLGQMVQRAPVVMPEPTPYRPPDVVRAGLPLPTVTTAPKAGGCGGSCGGSCGPCGASSPAATIAAPLVMTGNETPTSGALDLSHLPAPAGLELKLPAGDPRASTPLPDHPPDVGDQEKGSLVWVVVVIALVLILTDGKGSRKNW